MALLACPLLGKTHWNSKRRLVLRLGLDLGIQRFAMWTVWGGFLVVLWLGLVRESRQRSGAWELCAAAGGQGAGPLAWRATVERVGGDRWVLGFLQVYWAGAWMPMARRLSLSRTSLERGSGGSSRLASAGVGEQTGGWAQLRCFSPLRNPIYYGALFVEHLPQARWPGVRLANVQRVWHEPSSARRQIAHSFSAWLVRSLDLFPQLKALAFAAWFADDSQFSKAFLDWHRNTGLSHTLAVSGQHVVLLAVGLRFCFRLVMVPAYFLFSSTKSMFWLLELAQVFAAGIYLLLCPVEGSVWRATSAALLASALRYLYWHSQRLQLFCSILALALCWEPASALNWGFLLSSAGTFLLFSSHSLWKSYLAVSLLLPLAMLPLQLHFFWKWDWATCLHAVAFCWLWAGVWIPLAFVVPVLAALPHGEGLLGIAETAFTAFSHWVVQCPTWSHVAVRPAFWEAVAWTSLGVGVARALPPICRRLARAFRARSDALKLAAPCIDFRRKTVWNK